MKLFLFLALGTASAFAAPPLRYVGTETATTAPDGGLRPVVGVHNQQIYRASRTAPTHLDGLKHTYLHQPMLAYWNGRFYVEYLSGAVNEHDNPTDTSLLTSVDGLTWEAPRTIFPAFKLPDGSFTITHQRMGFYVAPNGKLLALAFHGRSPSPNDGTGVGRVVREIHRDGSFGPIHFIRMNAGNPKDFVAPYPLYSASTDRDFVAACEALLADRLMTAQWWEEDALDKTGRYSVSGKALSYVTRPDGSTLGIWKNRLVSVTRDRGVTWDEKQFASNMPNNASKYWLQRTADGKYALVFNPTDRLRHPLAVLTSPDAENFDHLLAIHGELPDQRYGGGYKNLGPQYVRGIVEGNGTPLDAARAFWLTYSVNKEDIWVARVPTPITATVDGPVRDDFNAAAPGALPADWNTYSPLWAPVRIAAVTSDNHALELRDAEPYDYAAATRVFPATHGVKISFRVFARQTSGRLEVDLVTANGLRPVRLAFAEDGQLWACHEGQWDVAGRYTANQWHTVELEIPPSPTADRCAVLLDGKTELPRPAIFTDPAATVERLVFRTGKYRFRGEGGRDLPGADARVTETSFLIDDVSITPTK
jgi:hypothetical protein